MIKMRDIVEAQEVLAKIANSDMSAISAFKIAQIINTTKNTIDSFNASKAKIIEKYSLFVDGDTSISEAAEKEFSELLDIDLDIDFKKISIDDIADISITPMAMKAITWLID